MDGFISKFSTIFTDRNDFCDFLFVFLNDTALPKQSPLLGPVEEQNLPSIKVNPTALRMAKTLWSLGHSECNRVKMVRLSCTLLA